MPYRLTVNVVMYGFVETIICIVAEHYDELKELCFLPEIAFYLMDEIIKLAFDVKRMW